MDHVYIEENQVVDRYLMEKLTTVEAARFEAHYLHCQQCLDQLELGETFLHDFRRSAAREAARATGTGIGILAWFLRRRAHQVVLMVGAVLVAVLVPVRFERRLAEEQQARNQLTEKLSRAYQPQLNTLVLPLRKERGAAGTSTEPSRRIRLGSSPEWIVFSLELEESSAGHYRVTLIDETENEVWRSDPFDPDAGGGLSLSLHSSWLEPGDYRMQAEAVEPSGETVSATYFSFRVLPGP